MSKTIKQHTGNPLDPALAKCYRQGHVALIDDDQDILSALAALLELEGYACDTYTSALDYLQVLNKHPNLSYPRCVLCDVQMPDLDGLALQQRLAQLGDTPVLLMSGTSGVEEAVSAFRGGALDFLIKPINADVLLSAIVRALNESIKRQARACRRSALAERIANLTVRERQILRRVAHGQTNPVIADDLGIALRTVKLHRQRAMEKIGASGMAALVRIADEGDL